MPTPISPHTVMQLRHPAETGAVVFDRARVVSTDGECIVGDTITVGHLRHYVQLLGEGQFLIITPDQPATDIRDLLAVAHVVVGADGIYRVDHDGSHAETGESVPVSDRGTYPLAAVWRRPEDVFMMLLGF